MADTGTAIAQMMQMLTAGAPPSAGTVTAQPMAAPSPSPSPSPMTGVLSDAMRRLNTTPYQPTPSAGGGLDPSHPLAKVIQALAGGASSYGWTAMPPAEREARTQMEQQKAETMARLAQAGVAQEQTASWRRSEAETAAERAKAYERDVASKEEARKTQAQIAQDRIDVQREMVGVRKSIGEGRLQVAHDTLTMRASQFEQMFKLRAQQVGIEQAKLELMEQGNMIKQGFLDVARGALSQRGTVEGAQIAEKLQQIGLDHPLLSHVFGLSDVADLVGQSRGAQIPGAAPSQTPLAPAATAPLPAAPVPQKPRAKAAPKPTGGPAPVEFVRRPDGTIGPKAAGTP